MSWFSRSKGVSQAEAEAVEILVEVCRQAAAGDLSVRAPVDLCAASMAQIAIALNAALEGAERRIAATDDAISRATDTLHALSRGDLDARIAVIGDDGPAAGMQRAVNEMAEVTDAFVREAGASLEAVGRNVYYRKVITAGLRGEFRRTAEHVNEATAAMGRKVDGFTAMTERLVDNVRGVADSVAGMTASVSEVSAIADDASRRSASVAAAVEETATGLQSIASAAEQMLFSVAEINRQVVHSADVTRGAQERMSESNEVVQTLSDAAASINKVLDLINAIAGQTNLLALNATIEAARAGEAGKGFAVVAGEVKSLAGQTARATEDIAAQVRAVQDATSATVETIDRLGETVGEIDDISGAIASAITEQETTTREISSNIQSAAAGSQEVSDNIQQVSAGARRNSEAAEQLRAAMERLQGESAGLVAEATAFLDAARKTGTD